MRKLNTIILMTAFFTVACSGEDETVYDEQQEDYVVELDRNELLNEIEVLESEIVVTQTPDKEKMNEAIAKFQDFANAFPDDPKAPDFLLKASDFSLALDYPEKSVRILDRIIDEYPKYERMEDVMYVKASHLDLNLRDTTKAKEAYQAFIDEYPSSILVPDAESRIENISLSLEELAEKFMQGLEAQ